MRIECLSVLFFKEKRERDRTSKKGRERQHEKTSQGKGREECRRPEGRDLRHIEVLEYGNSGTRVQRDSIKFQSVQCWILIDSDMPSLDLFLFLI